MTPPTLAAIRTFVSNNRWLVVALILSLTYALIHVFLPADPYSGRIFYPLLLIRTDMLDRIVLVLILIALCVGGLRIAGRSELAYLAYANVILFSCGLFGVACCYSGSILNVKPVDSIRHNDHVYRLTYGWEWCSDFDCTTYWYTVLECDKHGLFCYRVDSMWGGDPRALPEDVSFVVDEAGVLYLQYGENRLPIPSRE